MATEFDVDALIFGRGAAGLWTLNYLQSRGYELMLIEKDSLGNGQTIVSQEIIHGGVKYALSADLREDSIREISEVPARWLEHLSGQRNDLDLSTASVSSRSCYLWVSKGRGVIGTGEVLMSRAGVKILNIKPKKLRNGQAPDWLERSAEIVYSIAEPVVDTKSLLEVLAKRYQARIIYSDSESMEVKSSGNPFVVKEVRFDNGEIVIRPQNVILTVGLGNQSLAYKMGITKKLCKKDL